MTAYDYDLFVIGAGSGGVRAARVAAAHGARVAIAEEHKVGGTCVIRGCVPKKLLVHGAHFAEDLKDAKRFGWRVPDCVFDWPTLRDNVLAEVARLNLLYVSMLEHHDIAILNEHAKIAGPHDIHLASDRTVTARRILIASGAWPVVPEIEGADHGVTSNEIFHLEKLPRRVVIVGAGYIANEFAGIFRELSCEVTLVTRSDSILRSYDQSLQQRLLEISTAKGIVFRFHAPCRKVDKGSDGSLTVHAGEGPPIECDLLVFAAGRRPKIENLGLENAAIATNVAGAIIVDADNRTSCESIYAVGDVTDRVQLTPVAIREGQAFADTVYGGAPHRPDYSNVPSAVFSHPPLAAVGLTEAEALEKIDAIDVYTSDFRPMKNVLAGRNERSLYKMIVDPATDRVIGLHMIGPDTPEILQVAAVAIRAGLTKHAFDDTIALHPSMAEELVLMSRSSGVRKLSRRVSVVQ